MSQGFTFRLFPAKKKPSLSQPEEQATDRQVADFEPEGQPDTEGADILSFLGETDPEKPISDCSLKQLQHMLRQGQITQAKYNVEITRRYIVTAPYRQ